MKLNFDRIQMERLMKDFYILTGMKLALFDSEGSELLAYPDSNCAFCTHLKSNPALRILCDQSDRRSFEKCRAKKALVIYRCHAGLVEASAPLIEHNRIIGYLMFGQISNLDTEEKLAGLLRTTLSEAGILDAYLSGLTKDIPQKSDEQIQAAAKIMEACTFYVISKDTVSVQKQNFIHNMHTWILSHIDEDLSVARITSEFGISRSKLYQVCDNYLGCGIAEYIHNLRLEKAKDLLKHSDLPIAQVAAECGYSDYTYFCRTFKRETGSAAKEYRASESPVRNTAGGVGGY